MRDVKKPIALRTTTAPTAPPMMTPIDPSSELLSAFWAASMASEIMLGSDDETVTGADSTVTPVTPPSASAV